MTRTRERRFYGCTDGAIGNDGWDECESKSGDETSAMATTNSENSRAAEGDGVSSLVNSVTLPIPLTKNSGLSIEENAYR